MQINNHILTIDGYTEDLPRLAVPAIVRVWSVPTGYMASGYFVSVQQAGQPKEVPACSGRDIAFIGSAELPADEGAVLDAAKVARRAEINARRDELMYSTYTHTDGHPYDVDTQARQKLTGTYALAVDGVLTSGITWTAADDSEVEHTEASIKALCQGIMAWTDALHHAAREHKTALAALESVAEVVGYDISSGWPE